MHCRPTIRDEKHRVRFNRYGKNGGVTFLRYAFNFVYPSYKESAVFLRYDYHLQ